MKAFFMLAGTLMTSRPLETIQELLSTQGIESDLDENELRLQCPASFELRYGFDHELIVVGDSFDRDTLEQQTHWLSSALKQLQMAHEFELYDTANKQILDIQYTPAENH